MKKLRVIGICIMLAVIAVLPLYTGTGVVGGWTSEDFDEYVEGSHPSTWGRWSGNPTHLSIATNKSYTGEQSLYGQAPHSPTTAGIYKKTAIPQSGFSVSLWVEDDRDRKLIYSYDDYLGDIAVALSCNLNIGAGWEYHDGSSWVSLNDFSVNWSRIEVRNMNYTSNTFDLLLNGEEHIGLNFRENVDSSEYIVIQWGGTAYSGLSLDLWIDDFSVEIEQEHSKADMLAYSVHGWYTRNSIQYNGTVYIATTTHQTDVLITTIDDETGKKSNNYNHLHRGTGEYLGSNDHLMADMHIIREGPYARHIALVVSEHLGGVFFFLSEYPENISSFVKTEVVSTHGTYGFLVETEDGNLHIFTREGSSHPRAINHYYSLDWGGTWGLFDTIFPASGESSYIMVFYEEETGRTHIGINRFTHIWSNLYYMYSDDNCTTWKDVEGNVLNTPIEFSSNITATHIENNMRIFDIKAEGGEPYLLGLTNSTSSFSNLTYHYYDFVGSVWVKEGVAQTSRLGTYETGGGYQTGGHIVWGDVSRVWVAKNIDPSDSSKTELFSYKREEGVWSEEEQITNFGGQVARPISVQNAENTEVLYLSVYDYTTWRDGFIMLTRVYNTKSVSTVEIVTSAAITITAGDTVSFSAWANDTYGNIITDDVSLFTWTNATNGVFNEEIVGEYNVSATYGGVTSNFTVVTVEAPPPPTPHERMTRGIMSVRPLLYAGITIMVVMHVFLFILGMFEKKSKFF